MSSIYIKSGINIYCTDFKWIFIISQTWYYTQVKFKHYTRDIKSSNILVKDKVIKLADFGMSRYSGKTSFMISYVGTPFYMAPQILK